MQSMWHLPRTALPQAQVKHHGFLWGVVYGFRVPVAWARAMAWRR